MKQINEIKRHNILIVGDVMLDTYFYGDVNRISPEAPVPVFKKNRERHVLGGAANVAANLIAAGQAVSVLSVIGKDEAGNKIKDLFDSFGIDSSLILINDRPTTEKIRFLASNNQQVMRLDVEETSEFSSEDYACLVEAYKGKLNSFDIVIISTI